jgi:hypothetical protein
MHRCNAMLAAHANHRRQVSWRCMRGTVQRVALGCEVVQELATLAGDERPKAEAA